MKKLRNLCQSKQAWIKIVEAFVSVLLVMSVVLIVIVRNQPTTSTADEIGRIQKYALGYITTNDLLRSQILWGYLGGVNDQLKALIPGNLNYSLKICDYNANNLCSLGFIVPSEVYSDEAIIFANLTYYDPNNAKKLKIFFWMGNYPAGITPPDYYANKPVETGPVCGNSICENGEDSVNCVIDCPAVQAPTTADIFVSNWQKSVPYLWYDPAIPGTATRINWTITISNNNAVNWIINNFTSCWKSNPPSSYGGKLCQTTNAPANLIVNNTSSWTPTNKFADTTFAGNLFNFTYTGTDINGHVFSIFEQIQFP